MNSISANKFINEGSGKITLCGSTKFFIECMEANRILTFNNWMVYACGSWGHSYHKYAKVDNNHDYAVVKKLHFLKILESQAIVVVFDKSKYIGESTKAEIEFAKYRNIPVFEFDGEGFTGFTNKYPIDELSDTSIVDNFAINNSLGF